MSASISERKRKRERDNHTTEAEMTKKEKQAKENMLHTLPPQTAVPAPHTRAIQAVQSTIGGRKTRKESKRREARNTGSTAGPIPQAAAIQSD